jgi:hypothetical protein
MAFREPQIGQCYRRVGSVSRNAVWVLTAIFTNHGIDHGRLTSVYDASDSKTLAVSVIADTRRFTLAEASDKSTD